jgi:hypothetical protein
MRGRAMLGDAAGMAEARVRAAAAMVQLGPPNSAASVYSVPRAEDPPYTATSLLLAGRYDEAAQLTRRIIETAYHPQSQVSGDQPTNYARYAANPCAGRRASPGRDYLAQGARQQAHTHIDAVGIVGDVQNIEQGRGSVIG